MWICTRWYYLIYPNRNQVLIVSVQHQISCFRENIEEEKKHRPLFPTPGAPITASLTSDRVDFFRRTWSRIWYSHASKLHDQSSKILSITKYSKIKTVFESTFGFHNITFIYLTYTADSTCGAHLLFENTPLLAEYPSLFTLYLFHFLSLFFVLANFFASLFLPLKKVFFLELWLCSLSWLNCCCCICICCCCSCVCCGYSFLSRRCTRSPSLPRAPAASHSGSSLRSEITMMMVMIKLVMMMTRWGS